MMFTVCSEKMVNKFTVFHSDSGQDNVKFSSTNIII